MSLAKGVLNTCDGFIDRVLCLLGALLFSQAPEFFQQYAQRLGGHVDEARRQVDQYRHVAEQSNLTLDQFIHQTNANADPAVAKLAAVMSDATERLHALQDAQTALSHATVFTRPLVFLQHVDRQIAEATWHIYKPAFPTTLEGLVYALIGMVILLGVYHLLFRIPVRTGYRRWRRRRYPHLVEA